MSEHQSVIIDLGKKVARLSEEISKSYQAAGVPEPTLEPNSSEVLESPEYNRLRASLNEAANELTYLVTGPKKALRAFGASHFDLAAFQTAIEFGFFEAIPLGGTKTLTELATTTNLSENQVASVLRILVTHLLFVENEPGVFGHTSYSAIMAKDSDIKSAAHMQ